jgi:hypothetical protein
MKKRRSKSTLIALLLPLLAIRIAEEVASSARDVTRSAYKGAKKQVVRAQRRKTNKQAATRDIAAQISKPEVTERNRLQSHFLQLPLELRQQIYEDYFKAKPIELHEYSAHGFRLSYKVGPYRNRPVFHVPYSRNGKDLLQLPLACRQIYSETIHYIYERHTFHIPGHLALAMLRLELFPQKHLDSLRSIELKFCFDVLAQYFKTAKLRCAPYCEKAINPWMAHIPGRYKKRREWLAGWKLIAELPMLERLRVEFAWLPGPIELRSDEIEWIMAPLLQFKRPKPLVTFEVVASSIPDPVSPGWAKAVPYQLKSI